MRRFRILLLTSVLALLQFGLSMSQDEIEGGWSSRIEELLEAGRPDEAIAIADRAVLQWPEQSNIHLIHGMVTFRTGDIAGSLKDFDRSIEIEPRSASSCWQRGITLYYLEQYEKGREQFITHRTVNPNDVENAFWHFLCVAKLEGIEPARKQLLQCGRDSRVPLMEVLAMLQGSKTANDVVAAIDSAKGSERSKTYARFYGYLYLGLYYEALGDKKSAEDFLNRCVEQKVGGYMADVAKIDLQLRQARDAVLHADK